MARVEEIVGKIRGVLESGDLRATEELVQLAQQFKEVSEAALRRLQRCDEYLLQGRYPEAIHLASEPPALLELISALNFPEAQAWQDVILMYNWPAAPRISMEQAAQLNIAFGIYPNVEPVFKRYRQLCLTGGPLAERLQVLREIETRLGRVYPAIDGQIRELETERLKTLGAELQLAIQRNEPEKVKALYAELTDPRWRTPVPQHLLQMATLYMQNLQVQELRQHLDRVGQRLKKAMMQRDFTAGQQLFQEWNQLAMQLGLSPADELWMRYRQPLDWVRELSEVYAVANKPDVTTEELAAYEEVIFRWRKCLPAYLEQIYERALEEAQTVETRWRQTVVAISVLVCLVLVVVVLYFLTR